ncbi:MAG: YqgE/AlgH family protein [Solirubrobacterales bacterium]|nr:YqgE/AlgH family protein [Solirubrobacterales bacterium]
MLGDPNFARTVVLVTEHGVDGAMGIVLNRPSGHSIGESVAELAGMLGDQPLWVGGPVQPNAVVVLAEFSDPSAAAWLVVADVGFLGADHDVEEIARSTRRARIYAGYSGWGPGQLEAELEREDWIVEAPIPRELFPEDPETLWADVLGRMGGQYTLISKMPEDPSVN